MKLFLSEHRKRYCCCGRLTAAPNTQGVGCRRGAARPAAVTAGRCSEGCEPARGVRWQPLASRPGTRASDGCELQQNRPAGKGSGGAQHLDTAPPGTRRRAARRSRPATAPYVRGTGRCARFNRWMRPASLPRRLRPHLLRQPTGQWCRHTHHLLQLPQHSLGLSADLGRHITELPYEPVVDRRLLPHGQPVLSAHESSSRGREQLPSLRCGRPLRSRVRQTDATLLPVGTLGGGLGRWALPPVRLCSQKQILSGWQGCLPDSGHPGRPVAHCSPKGP